MASQKILFQLALSADKYLSFYQGKVQNVMVTSIDNRKLKFPASAIRQFLTHAGIYGLFEIEFDENNKLKGIRRMD